MEAVRQLDQDDADVLRHGEEHLPQILSLDVQLVRGPVDLGQLRHAVHQLCDILTEHPRQLFLVQDRVLHDVVQKSCNDGFFVKLQIREDDRHADRMDHIGFAGFPALVHMRVLRRQISPSDQAGIIRRMISLDPSDQFFIQNVRIHTVTRLPEYSVPGSCSFRSHGAPPFPRIILYCCFTSDNTEITILL